REDRARRLDDLPCPGAAGPRPAGPAEVRRGRAAAAARPRGDEAARSADSGGRQGLPDASPGGTRGTLRRLGQEGPGGPMAAAAGGDAGRPTGGPAVTANFEVVSRRRLAMTHWMSRLLSVPYRPHPDKRSFLHRAVSQQDDELLVR